MERSKPQTRRLAVEVVMDLSSPTYGYFLSRDAAALGISAAALSRLRSRGVVESVAHGVNRLSAWQDTWEGRALAAIWSSGPRAALARRAALRVLEGRHTSPRIEVVTPRHTRPSGSTARLRSHVRLSPADVLDIGRFRVTSAAFSVCDLAAVTTVDELTRTADRLVANDLLSLDDLRVMVGRFWGVQGVGRLREMLPRLSPGSRWTRSDGERTFRRLASSEPELPPLVVNVRVTDADGRTRYLDFAWPELRVAFEIDIHPSHGTTIGRHDDGSRQNALVLAGWTVIRFDLIDLMTRPDHVLATVVAAHAQATARR